MCQLRLHIVKAKRHHKKTEQEQEKNYFLTPSSCTQRCRVGLSKYFGSPSFLWQSKLEVINRKVVSGVLQVILQRSGSCSNLFFPVKVKRFHIAHLSWKMCVFLKYRRS